MVIVQPDGLGTLLAVRTHVPVCSPGCDGGRCHWLLDEVRMLLLRASGGSRK